MPSIVVLFVIPQKGLTHGRACVYASQASKIRTTGLSISTLPGFPKSGVF